MLPTLSRPLLSTSCHWRRFTNNWSRDGHMPTDTAKFTHVMDICPRTWRNSDHVTEVCLRTWWIQNAFHEWQLPALCIKPILVPPKSLLCAIFPQLEVNFTEPGEGKSDADWHFGFQVNYERAQVWLNNWYIIYFIDKYSLPWCGNLLKIWNAEYYSREDLVSQNFCLHSKLGQQIWFTSAGLIPHATPHSSLSSCPIWGPISELIYSGWQAAKGVPYHDLHLWIQ